MPTHQDTQLAAGCANRKLPGQGSVADQRFRSYGRTTKAVRLQSPQPDPHNQMLTTARTRSRSLRITGGLKVLYLFMAAAGSVGALRCLWPRRVHEVGRVAR